MQIEDNSEATPQQSEHEGDERAAELRGVNDAQRQLSAANDALRSAKSEVAWQDKWMVRLTLALVLVGCLQFLDGLFQWLEMRSSSVDSARLTQAAIHNADEAKHANEIATQLLKASERPWLGITTSSTSVLSPHRDFKISLRVTNSGKGPAFNAAGIFVAEPFNPRTDQIAWLPKCSTDCSYNTIMPNAGTMYDLTVLGAFLTEQEVRRIKSGADTIIIFGRLEYRDQQRTPHMTTLCGYYVASRNSFQGCGSGNEAY